MHQPCAVLLLTMTLLPVVAAQTAAAPDATDPAPAASRAPPIELPTVDQPASGEPTQAPAAPADETRPATTPRPATDTAPAPADTAADAATPSRLSAVWLIAAALGIVVLAAALALRARRVRRPSTERGGTRGPTATLEEVGRSARRVSHELGTAPTVIGRMPGLADDGRRYLVIPEDTIGQRHAVIERAARSWWVRDLGSVNGTFVNGRRVHVRTRLRHGDRLRFNRREFEFRLHHAPHARRGGASDRLSVDLPPADEDAPAQPPPRGGRGGRR